jgi:hypothetical protein
VAEVAPPATLKKLRHGGPLSVSDEGGAVENPLQACRLKIPTEIVLVTPTVSVLPFHILAAQESDVIPTEVNVGEAA